MLRNRIGKAALVTVRERCGGLLVLLERHPRLFRVDRIPKNDAVALLPSTQAEVSDIIAATKHGSDKDTRACGAVVFRRVCCGSRLTRNSPAVSALQSCRRRPHGHQASVTTTRAAPSRTRQQPALAMRVPH